MFVYMSLGPCLHISFSVVCYRHLDRNNGLHDDFKCARINGGIEHAIWHAKTFERMSNSRADNKS